VLVPAKKTTPKTPKTKSGRPAHRPVVLGVVSSRTIKFDAELEELFTSEFAVRQPLYRDIGAYSEAAAVRQLIREAILAARARRELGQQTLPLESSTTKS
jgi:hypothetical protein